ncbi:MAG: response regulator, partial [Calditrichia bacterium]|nr:response regulator [Calditrichia bacterium]
LLEQFLGRFNFTSLKAINGKVGIEVLNENSDKIDLVILDYMMPEVNGEEMYDYMKENYPQIPAILLTGVEDERIIERFIAKGISSVIRKPFTGADVVENIYKAFKKEESKSTLTE